MIDRVKGHIQYYQYPENENIIITHGAIASLVLELISLLDLDISVFAFQASILIIPVLPSTPSVFIPIVFVIFRSAFNYKRRLFV